MSVASAMLGVIRVRVHQPGEAGKLERYPARGDASKRVLPPDPDAPRRLTSPASLTGAVTYSTGTGSPSPEGGWGGGVRVTLLSRSQATAPCGWGRCAWTRCPSAGWWSWPAGAWPGKVSALRHHPYSRIDAIPDPPRLTDLRWRCEAMLPRVDIGELILEVMSWEPRFVGVQGGLGRPEPLR